MKIEKVYIVTGAGKDPSGKYKSDILQTMRGQGAVEVSTPEEAELILVLGGDGTIMRASHTAHRLDLPIVGVNLGRIGYLAELETNNPGRLSEILSGNYTEEPRMMLEIRLRDTVHYALNDAVIRAEGIHPAFVTLMCDGRAVTTYRGDGVICSTPTGSTAYSVSAGGSVVDPRLNCFCITPLCPQSFVARPLIFSPDCALTLRAEEGYRCILTFDGEDAIPLTPNEEVTVTRSERPLRMLRASDDGFFSILSRKMHSI